MKERLSVVMVTQNASDMLDKSLASVKGLADEIIVVDDYSTDKTRLVAQQYDVKVILHHSSSIGEQKSFAVNLATGIWILSLDSDEIISEELKKEIRGIIHNQKQYDGFLIPYQNHFLGRAIYRGGENYKMLRLFKKGYYFIDSDFIHEHFTLKNRNIGALKSPILHHSYRSVWQTYKKFTIYSFWHAKQRVKDKEKLTLKKLTLYPLHMVWARFINDKGYQDGLIRLPLDIGFGYMEFLSYFLMLFVKK